MTRFLFISFTINLTSKRAFALHCCALFHQRGNIVCDFIYEYIGTVAVNL